MIACFLEKQFDRYGNAPKYVVPSAAASLGALNFKISTLIQDSGYQIIKMQDLEFPISVFRISSLAIISTLRRRYSAIISSGSILIFNNI